MLQYEKFKLIPDSILDKANIMNELHITTPIFYSRFKCIGSECIEHCCKGWSVSIDKDTYNKYKNSDVFLIRDVAQNQMQMVKKNHAQYGLIKLKEDGNCPLLDEERLCQVYKHMGPNALSHTCTTYPRIEREFREEKRLSLSLSCPEATRLVLFNEDAMFFEDSVQIIPKYKTIPSFHPAHKIINLFCVNLMMAPSKHIEDNLYAVANFLVYCQSLKFDVNNQLQEIEGTFVALLDSLEQGQEHTCAKTLKNNASNKIKMNMMILFQSISSEHSNSRGRKYLSLNNSSVLAYFDNFTQEMDDEYLTEKFTTLNTHWDTLLTEGIFADRTILMNYFLYRMYHDSFPGKDLNKSLRAFYHLIADYFYIKTSLSVIASRKAIEQSDVINMFYSFHTLKQHNQTIEKQLDDIISKTNLGDDISALMLLS